MAHVKLSISIIVVFFETLTLALLPLPPCLPFQALTSQPSTNMRPLSPFLAGPRMVIVIDFHCCGYYYYRSSIFGEVVQLLRRFAMTKCLPSSSTCTYLYSCLSLRSSACSAYLFDQTLGLSCAVVIVIFIQSQTHRIHHAFLIRGLSSISALRRSTTRTSRSILESSDLHQVSGTIFLVEISIASSNSRRYRGTTGAGYLPDHPRQKKGSAIKPQGPETTSLASTSPSRPYHKRD